MYILTNQQMRDADRYTIETLNVPSLTLMERAGRALADRAKTLAGNGSVVCVCGGGNNGGDGFVCARLLKEMGVDARVVCFSDKFSKECAENKSKWEEMGGEILASLPTEKNSLIIDCLFGTGFKGELTGKALETVEQINACKEKGVKVLSADIPSGLNGDNGLCVGACVKADETICIGEMKAGVILNDGKDFAGEIKRVDIGISLPSDNYATLIDHALAKTLLPKRKNNSHKGTFGKTAIVGGSMDYTGAAYLSAIACLRSGVGYTTLFIPNDLLPYYFLKTPELLLKGICDGGRYAFNGERMKTLLEFDSIAYGMGMGCSLDVAKGAKYLLKHYTGKLVLDADGLNSLAAFAKEELLTLFTHKKCDVLLTPHCKEFSRLSQKSVADVIADGLQAANEFAQRYNVSVLLKSATSILTDGKTTLVNATGNCGQAKGGSGDVLSGLIAGLCGSGVSVFNAGALGAFLSGVAADLAVKDVGVYALTASDCAQYISKAFLSLS